MKRPNLKPQKPDDSAAKRASKTTGNSSGSKPASAGNPEKHGVPASRSLTSGRPAASRAESPAPKSRIGLSGGVLGKSRLGRVSQTPHFKDNPHGSRTTSRQASNSTFIARLLTLGVVALAVFLVVFSPLKSWMEQQQQARELAAEIERVKADNEDLEDEIARYNDPEYISRQARERLGYVKPGETTYVVIDPPGKEKPQLANGWLEKDTNDLPWFGLLVAGLEVAGGTSQ